MLRPWPWIFSVVGIAFPEESGELFFREKIWGFRTELWHLFGRDKVSITVSKLKQISGKLPQWSHGIIQAARLSLIFIKETVCACLVRQIQMRILFFHMALVIFQIPLLCTVDVPEAAFIRNESINPFPNSCLLHALSPSFGKGSVSDAIVSRSVERYTIVES